MREIIVHYEIFYGLHKEYAMHVFNVDIDKMGATLLNCDVEHAVEMTGIENALQNKRRNLHEHINW